MKYIMSNAVTQRVSPLYSFMVDQEGDAARYLEDFLTQKNIELFYLIKGDAEGANRTPV